MRTRYYVGDRKIPWWVQELIDRHLVLKIKSLSITDILIYQQGYFDNKKRYLYEGDFLEYNDKTGCVTIGFHDWSKALSGAKPNNFDN